MTHEHLVIELVTLIPWTADGKAEQEARERAETASRSLNVFISCSANISSKKKS